VLNFADFAASVDATPFLLFSKTEEEIAKEPMVRVRLSENLS
jgi:hypothetical protein